MCPGWLHGSDRAPQYARVGGLQRGVLSTLSTPHAPQYGQRNRKTAEPCPGCPTRPWWFEQRGGVSGNSCRRTGPPFANARAWHCGHPGHVASPATQLPPIIKTPRQQQDAWARSAHGATGSSAASMTTAGLPILTATAVETRKRWIIRGLSDHVLATEPRYGLKSAGSYWGVRAATPPWPAPYAREGANLPYSEHKTRRLWREIPSGKFSKRTNTQDGGRAAQATVAPYGYRLPDKTYQPDSWPYGFPGKISGVKALVTRVLSNYMSTTEPQAAVDRLADSTALSREELLQLLQGGLAECARKCREGRIRDAENEKVRVRQWKALAYMVRAYNEVLEDLEAAAEVEDRLEELEAATGIDGEL